MKFSNFESEGAAKCTLPLTASGVVSVLITDIAKFRITDGKLYLVKPFPGVSLEEIKQRTDADYQIALE